MSKNLSQGPSSLYHSLSWPSLQAHWLSVFLFQLTKLGPTSGSLQLLSPSLNHFAPRPSHGQPCPKCIITSSVSLTYPLCLKQYCWVDILGETNVGHICDCKLFSSHIKIFSRGEINFNNISI